MINNKEFTIRLEEIFDHYNINAAGFAEKIGIGRSSVSHIVSGRNKPSLDFVMHILDNFPEITFDWLVYGKGELAKNSSLTENRIFEPELRNESNIKFSSHSPNLFNSAEKDTKTEILGEESIISAALSTSEIDSITIFYKDGTFKNYKQR